jgi:hypothetical protein
MEPVDIIKGRPNGSTKLRILGYVEMYAIKLLKIRIDLFALRQKGQVTYQYKILDA